MAYYKKVLQLEEVSTDGGVTWTRTGRQNWVTVGTYNTMEECNGATGETRWIDDGFYLCEGYDKYSQQKEQVSYDGGTTWTDTGNVRKGTLLEKNSVDCGYQPQTSFKAKFINGGATAEITCDGNTMLSRDEIINKVWDTYSASSVVEIGTCVTTIGNESFSGMTRLTSVTIPNSVTIMQNKAFEGCKELKSVVIPNSVTQIEYDAFKGCSGLTSITLSNRLSFIPDDFCGSATSLASIVIPSSVAQIGIGSFEGCSSLTSVTIPSSVSKIYGKSFKNCTSLQYIEISGNTPPALSGETFDNTNNCPIYVPCASMNTYKTAWPQYADRIQCRATPTTNTLAKLILNNNQTIDIVKDGTNLEQEDVKAYSATTVSVQITTACTKIGLSTFNSFASMTSVTVPNSVETIGDMAFGYCDSLASFTIPTNLQAIPPHMLVGCSSLTNITIPSNISEIGNYAFNDCTGLTSVAFETDYIGRIGWDAFKRCLNIKSLKLPEVRVIDNGAFDYCLKLSAVTLSEYDEFSSDCERIGNGAFRECGELKIVELNQDVLEFSDYAFEGCTALTSFKNVMCRSEAQPGWPKVSKLGVNVFKDVDLTQVTFKVPNDCLTNYQDEWGSNYNFEGF